MSSLELFEKNTQLVGNMIASQKLRTQKSAILVITNKGLNSVAAVKAAVFANNMSSIEVPASQIHEPETLKMLKDMDFMGLLLIITGISKANQEACAIMNELVVNIYAGLPTWLHPDSQLLLIDYVEDHDTYGNRVLEPAAVDRTSMVNIFGW